MRKPADEKNRRLAAKIAEYQKVYGVKADRLAEKLGVTPPTLYARLRDPGTLKLAELRRIVQALNIPMEEITPFVL